MEHKATDAEIVKAVINWLSARIHSPRYEELWERKKNSLHKIKTSKPEKTQDAEQILGSISYYEKQG